MSKLWQALLALQHVGSRFYDVNKQAFLIPIVLKHDKDEIIAELVSEGAPETTQLADVVIELRKQGYTRNVPFSTEFVDAYTKVGEALVDEDLLPLLERNYLDEPEQLLELMY